MMHGKGKALRSYRAAVTDFDSFVIASRARQLFCLWKENTHRCFRAVRPFLPADRGELVVFRCW